MKKLSKTEAEWKKSAANKKKRVIALRTTNCTYKSLKIMKIFCIKNSSIITA